MTPPILRPGSPPVIDNDGNLWLPAYDENDGPMCIARMHLERFAKGDAGADPRDIDTLGRLVAALLGVRPIPEARPVAILGPRAKVDRGGDKPDHELTDQQLADRYETADPDELVAIGRQAERSRIAGVAGAVPCPNVCPECGGTCDGHGGGCPLTPDESAEHQEGARLERERIVTYLRAHAWAEGDLYADEIEAGRHRR